MKINGSQNSSNNNSTRGIAAGGCVSNTKQVDIKPKTTQESKPSEPTQVEPKDDVAVTDEAKDDKKDHKCDKCEDIKSLMDALKDMFGDKDKDEEKDKAQDKAQDAQQQGGGGGCKGGGGGGCNKSGGAGAAGDTQGGTDPVSRLKELLKKVEGANGQDKQNAIKELKDYYEKTKKCEIEIPDELKEQIEKAIKNDAVPHGGPRSVEPAGNAQSTKKAA